MTIKPLLTIAILLLLISCKKDDIQTDGNEKLVKLEMFDPVSQRTFSIDYKYDSLGKLTEVYSYTSGTSMTVKQLLAYDGSGKLVSTTQSNSVDGDVVRYDFQLDEKGRIIRSTGTYFLPNVIPDNHIYTYDNKSNLASDSTFPPPGSIYMQNGSFGGSVHFKYDNNNNVVSYQQYVNQGTSNYTQGQWTFQYDNKRNPFTKIGQILYTSFAGGVDYFYLSKHNTLKASLDDSLITPGGNFVYQYYDNSLLKTARLNVANTLETTYYYSK